MSTHTLDDTPNLKRKGITSIYTSTGISAALPSANGLQNLLRKYPEITTSFKYSEVIRYNTEHHIKTIGPPTQELPRRLRTENYKIAKSECQHVLNLGIIRQYSSPYASFAFAHGGKTRGGYLEVLWRFP